MSFSLSDPVSSLKGVGEARARALQKGGVATVGDLIFTFPTRYQSGKLFPIDAERVGIPSFFELTVHSAPAAYTMPGGRRALRFVAADPSGSKVHVIYLNQPYLKRQIFRGDRAFYFGTLQEKNGTFYLFSPKREHERPDPNRLIPIYPAFGTVKTKVIEKMIAQCLVPCLSGIEETLPQRILSSEKLLPRARAVFLLHNPTSEKELAQAKERFLFESLFTFSVQATLFADQSAKSTVQGWENGDLSAFLSTLPYSLTRAQKCVLEQIRADLCHSGLASPMNRLLQGDVGSGKTAVAAAACALALQNGKSALVMAPTEILAQQHYRSFSRFFAHSDVPVLLLTGATRKKERDAIRAVTTGDQPYLVIGTHALIEEGAECRNVGLAVTDEQHRFGVRQRTLLGEKGGAVHSLVMSATPIPRSLAMFLHAKRQISVIDELPPGRQQVQTLYVGEDKMDRIYQFLRERIAEGQRAYLVCPLIEDEEDQSELQSAKEEFDAIRKALPEIPVSLLHGKMKNEEKVAVMASFQSGESKILVSTTVIEVGVDVPEATVMVIRNAERFGLSQLHQLRGRVGRGSEKSWCILISSHSQKSARERLKKLCDCHDGFELAKYDLETRGPGEFFGTRQSGFSSLSFGNLSMALLQRVSEAAREFLSEATDEEKRPYEKKIGMN